MAMIEAADTRILIHLSGHRSRTLLDLQNLHTGITQDDSDPENYTIRIVLVALIFLMTRDNEPFLSGRPVSDPIRSPKLPVPILTVGGGSSSRGVAGTDDSGVVLVDDEAEGHSESWHRTRPSVNSFSRMLPRLRGVN